MLFASDLDGTLIYSRRFLEGLRGGEKKTLRLIETLNGKEISYISKGVAEGLREFNRDNYFVPVTTRSLQQYSRLSFFTEEIKPVYSIISNGGIILENGVPMKEWQNIMAKKLKDIPMGKERVLKEFFQLEVSKGVTATREVDGLFTYFIMDREKVMRESLIDFFRWLEENHWTGSLQGRKLYLIPNCINKRDPILFLMKKLGIEEFVAAGDSFLDLPMLKVANLAIVARHGELMETFGESLQKEGVIYTHHEGIKAGNEIMDTHLPLFSYSYSP